MKKQAMVLLCAATLMPSTTWADDLVLPQFRSLFNGKDLTGWVNINTAEDTCSVRDGLLVCSGTPSA